MLILNRTLSLSIKDIVAGKSVVARGRQPRDHSSYI
jgi:hypothetical protein